MNYLYVKDLLEGEYAAAFQRAEQYGIVLSLDTRIMDELMMNLADVLLTAQKNGTPLEKIIGADETKFCAEYFGSVTLKDRIKSVCRTMFYVFVFLLVLNCAALFAGDIELTNGFSMLVLPAAVGFIVGVLFELVSCIFFKRMFIRKKSASVKLYSFVRAVTILLTGGVSIYFIEKLDITIPVYAVIAVSALYILPYSAFWIYNKIKNDESIISSELREKRELGEKKYERMMVDTMVDAFNAKNRRLEKRKKPLMTKEEYMTKLRKKHCNTRRDKMLMFSVISIFIIIITVSEWINKGILAAAGALVISLIVVTVLLITQANKIDMPCRILNKCDEQGIDIFEYQKSIK